MGDVIVDFIASNPWKMVLVEQGPWKDVQAHLYRVQDRLYTCIEAAIEGMVAEQFPESRGELITLQLDCYNLPEPEVREFFDRFASTALTLPDDRDALASSPYVSGITFAITFATIPGEC
jgi:hypothetical protein